ncbi:DUF2256 and DUF3253 domain-containing protein [Allobranchiibius sp. GilTou73]|uniref:DUF2256 and DUF3253 domain-containing protein n=1 Tax=Allobranchiibius sp. GilTou73 TaxID=2904523 RepID=UPI001F25970B|nr:DUF2256 and DUF3253 domain-containing protein [Allobranchiibius sp. GilTou73]UIJ35209.1 DUF2256 and DUF3253 domain-containing protein [Allobranchiibius sp. GilTou73]
MSTPADRTCVSCGRRIEWRRKWERDWEQIRYCSAACRRRGVTQTDTLLEEAILDLLASGARSGTVSPSDAADAVTARNDTGEDLAEPARRAARRLVHSGQVVIVQGSRVVDPSTAKGPFRIRRV